MRRTRRYLIGCTAGALALAVGLAPAWASGGGEARSAGSGGWRTVATVPAGSTALLSAVTADRVGDAWAIGQVFAAGAPAPLVERWNGRAWHRVILPRGLVQPGVPYDPATAVTGPRDLWALGITGQWLHWDGAWTAGTLSGATDLDAAAMLGPRDVWTFGVLDPNTRPRPYAARYDGSRWHRVAVPGRDGIDGVSAVSPSDIWAVLGTPQTGAWHGPGALVHWNGRHWRTVAVRVGVDQASPAGPAVHRLEFIVQRPWTLVLYTYFVSIMPLALLLLLGAITELTRLDILFGLQAAILVALSLILVGIWGPVLKAAAARPAGTADASALSDT